jgi:phage-related minor tail protein
MARDPRDLKRLADELTALTPEERARVLAQVRQQRAARPLPKDFKPPVLTASGGRWVGGDLRRESLYGDDGR